MCKLALITSWFVAFTSARRLPTIYWNVTNPIFRIDNTDHVLSANIRDQIDIICPHFNRSDEIKQIDPRNKHLGYAQIFRVPEWSYTNCELTRDRQLVGVCNSPFDPSGEPVVITMVIREYTPNPNGLEFRPGKKYYFVSTSDGSIAGMSSTVGGLCRENQMKIMLKVLRGNRQSLFSPHSVAVSHHFLQPPIVSAALDSPPLSLNPHEEYLINLDSLDWGPEEQSHAEDSPNFIDYNNPQYGLRTRPSFIGPLSPPTPQPVPPPPIAIPEDGYIHEHPKFISNTQTPIPQSSFIKANNSHDWLDKSRGRALVTTATEGPNKIDGLDFGLAGTAYNTKKAHSAIKTKINEPVEKITRLNLETKFDPKDRDKAKTIIENKLSIIDNVNKSGSATKASFASWPNWLRFEKKPGPTGGLPEHDHYRVFKEDPMSPNGATLLRQFHLSIIARGVLIFAIQRYCCII